MTKTAEDGQFTTGTMTQQLGFSAVNRQNTAKLYCIHTRRFGSTSKAPAKLTPKYYMILKRYSRVRASHVGHVANLADACSTAVDYPCTW